MPNRAQILTWSAVTLMGVAVVMINSASMAVGDGPVDAMRLVTGRTTVYALLAVAAMVAVSLVPIEKVYRWRGWKNPAPWLLLAAAALCGLALVPGVGGTINGARRWLVIELGALKLTFQPSEMAKWALVVALAWWAARHPGALRRFGGGLVPAMGVIAGVCGLVVIEDLGTAVLMGAVGGTLLIAGGARLWHIAAMVPPALGAIALAIVTTPYRVQRVLSFLDPFADPAGANYHQIQMLSAIADGNLGLGNGVAKLGYLPADTTDAIFAIICEEMGLAGAALVVGVYMVMLWTALGVLRECRWVYGRLVVLGVAATIGLQAVMNIAVVTVVVPTKGIALPLLSSGGTGWVMTAMAIGLICAVDRMNRREAAARLPAAQAQTRFAQSKLATSVSASAYPVTS